MNIWEYIPTKYLVPFAAIFTALGYLLGWRRYRGKMPRY